MSSITKPSVRNNQSGISSLLFTLVMMIVITLIVLGFSQLARRSQRETLDAQLSSQAYYAAESGINDAEQILEQNIVADPSGLSTPAGSCIPPSGIYSNLFSGTNADLSVPDDVSYTCLTVTSQPSTLTGSVGQDASDVFSVNPVSDGNPVAPGDLTFSWQSPDASPSNTNCNQTTALVDDPHWTCSFAMLRIDIVPVNTVSRASFMANTMTAFIIPTKNASQPAVAYNVANSGTFGYGSCTDSLCSVDISNLTNTQYEVRVEGLYKAAPDITIAPDTPGVMFTNGQAVIDATGKAQDVLRRVQVRLSLGSSGDGAGSAGYSDFGLESNQSLCKRFEVTNTTYTDASDSALNCP